MAIVIAVPSTSWVSAVDDYFAHGALGRRWTRYARDGSLPRDHVPSNGCGTVATSLARGECVVGIASMPERVLPDTLIAAADFRIQIVVNAAVLREALRVALPGTPPRSIPEDLTRLDLDDYVAAMRPGSTCARALSRISDVATHRLGRSALAASPDLETAVEFGAARTWCLALAHDLNEYRAKRLPWSALDRGAIWHSPPGYGKTLLAHSLARKCDVPLITGSIGEIFASTSGFLDSVVKAQRELFSRAAAAAASTGRAALLFLDEIDALPSRESLKNSRGADFWMPVIADFLLLLDDATSGRREGIVVIAATNRIGAVDPAILRPGRLERSIEILPPDEAGIQNILRFHAPELKRVELQKIADRLTGYTAAEIMETVRAARRIARQASRSLAAEDIVAAALPSMPLSADAIYRVAVHEAGHAVVAYFLGEGRIGHIRIGARGALNAQTMVEFEDAPIVTRELMEKQAVLLLAGRAAEIELLGSASTGAGGDATGSDLGKATRMLASLHFSYGLGGDEIVHMCAPDEAALELRRSPSVRRQVDSMLRAFQTRALEIVRENRAAVAELAKLIAEGRFLSGNEIETVLDRHSGSPPRKPGRSS
ncbi:AAA family ATPase [Bradyrhizobium vignae]|uniref:AAA family ATPase n=1 Tax=Bradyrhizobium vignae TaxID=1549949 RepID=UPI0011AE6BFB|nr:AAA family ATPase [Bradyrhizobium vignae]